MDPVGTTFSLFGLGLRLRELIESKRKNRKDLIALSKELVNNLEQVEQLRQGQVKDGMPDVDSLLFSLQTDLEQIYADCEKLFENKPGFSGKMKSVFKFIDPDDLKSNITGLNETANKAYRKLLTGMTVQHSVSLANTNVELKQRDGVYMETVLRLEKLVMGQIVPSGSQNQDRTHPTEVSTSALAHLSLTEVPDGIESDTQMDTIFINYKVKSLSRELPNSKLLMAPHELPPEIDTHKISSLTYHMKTGDATMDRQMAIKETLDLLTTLKDPNSDVPAFIWYHRATMLTIILLELGLGEAALNLGQICLYLIRHMASTNPVFRFFLSITLNNLSNQFYHAGRHNQALDCAQESVAIARNERLDTQSLNFKVDLAIFLNTYSNRLSDVGRDGLALETCLESYTMRKGLAEQFPEVFKPDLAVVLNCLFNRYINAGKHQAAYDAIKEAMEIDREFAAKSPERFSARLAFTLRNYEVSLIRKGQTQEALTIIQESVSIYRTLHRDRPDAYAPALIDALCSLSQVYDTLDQNEEARAVILEAIELSRRLSEVNLYKAQLHLASSLHSQSGLFMASGLHKEALTSIQESVEIRRQLEETNPQVIRPELASSLTQLSHCFSLLKQHEAALDSMIEAVDIFFRLSEDRPTVFQPKYATALIMLAIKQSAVDGDDNSSLETIELAVDLLRSFSFERPSSDFREQLASALMDLSRRHKRLEQYEQSVDACQEAVAIYDQLNKQQLEKYGPILADVLISFSKVLDLAKQDLAAQGAIRKAISTLEAICESPERAKMYTVKLINAKVSLASQFSSQGQFPQAIEACQDAVTLSREKVAEDKERYEQVLAGTLHSLGNILQKSGNHHAAIVAAQESVSLYKRLSEEKPAEPKSKLDLVGALDGFCVILGSVGQQHMAMQTAAISVKFSRDLIENDAVMYRKTLADSLLTHAMFLSRSGRYQAALSTTEEAIGIIRVLHAEDPKHYEVAFARSLSNFAIELMRVGREQEALQVNQEAVSLVRRLAAKNPQLFDAQLSATLMTLFSNLYKNGQQLAALAAIEEAVKIARRLEQQQPETHTALLSSALNNLSSQLAEVGQLGPALDAADEAISIRRLLVADLPQMYEPMIATTLLSKAMILARLMRYAEARPCIEEAIQLYQRNIHVNPADIMQKIAVATQLLQGLQRAGSGVNGSPVF